MTNTPESHKARIVDLRAQLDELKEAEAKGKQMIAEGERLRVRSADAKRHVIALLRYYGDDVDDEQDAQPVAAVQVQQSIFDLSRPISQTRTSKKRKRLPKGWLEETVLQITREAKRALYIVEYDEAVLEQMAERFPDEPQIGLNRGSLNRVLKTLYKDGRLIRVTYDHVLFHIAPSYVAVDEQGDMRFDSAENAPNVRYLPDPHAEPVFHDGNEH
ncbi:MAG: hypothetical protein RhofKO_04660 [Rhodothermales bacterium]